MFEKYICANFIKYICTDFNNYMININDNDNINDLITENEEYKTNRNKLNNSINKYKNIKHFFENL
jgi:hypothetical protein